jgi:hypothetical protein
VIDVFCKTDDDSSHVIRRCSERVHLNTFDESVHVIALVTSCEMLSLSSVGMLASAASQECASPTRLR